MISFLWWLEYKFLQYSVGIVLFLKCVSLCEVFLCALGIFNFLNGKGINGYNIGEKWFMPPLFYWIATYHNLCWLYQLVSFLLCESLFKWEGLYGAPVLDLYSWQIKLQVGFFSPDIEVGRGCLINFSTKPYEKRYKILNGLHLFQDRRLVDKNWLVDLTVLSIEIFLVARYCLHNSLWAIANEANVNGSSICYA